MKICPICKNEFVSYRNIQKYCSKICYKIIKKELSKKWEYINKEERKKQYEEWYKLHRDELLQQQKEWYRTHKKQIKKYYILHKKEISLRGEEYYIKNKDKIRKQYKKWYKLHKKELTQRIKNRRRIDINFRIRCNLSRRVSLILRGNSKSVSTMKLLGCSDNFLKQYLQSKFTSGMSFKNYGKWHIDHIKPCASFDLRKKSEQIKCFNYTNLQPLWAKDNLKKGNKIIILTENGGITNV